MIGPDEVGSPSRSIVSVPVHVPARKDRGADGAVGAAPPPHPVRRAKPATADQAFPELTDREREILHLIAQGHSNSEIAERLLLSIKTVQNHVSNIFSKLQVADRAQAIIRARDAGLGLERDV